MGWDSRAGVGLRKTKFASKESTGPELGHEEILYSPWPREALMLYLSAHAVVINIQKCQFIIHIEHTNLQNSNFNMLATLPKGETSCCNAAIRSPSFSFL